MTAIFQTVLFMVAVLAAVAVAAKRLNVAPTILLVVAGLGIALVPGLPKVELAPEVVLLAILPPLIYSAGVAMSWRDFKFNLRPIALLAFGCVIFTTCAVAAAAHYLLNFGWAVGFLLGAIISPTDVVAPLVIAGKLGLPRRVVVVLEGRRPRQRCDRAGALPLRRLGGEHRDVFIRRGGRGIRPDRGR